MAKAKVTGVDKLIKQFEQFGSEGTKVTSAEVEASAREISTLAIRNAPANFGKLRQSIQPEKITPLTWEVVALASYAGYVEFGTGVYVSVPNELKDVAHSFKNQPGGNFEDMLDSIRDWCRSKGIDERAAYPIAVSILREGLRPRPFIFPAWQKGSKDMVKNLEKSFEVMSKKFNAAK